MQDGMSLDSLVGSVTADCLPEPAMYQYYKHLNNRKIIVNQEIGVDLLEYAILPLMEMDNDGSGEPIEILLSSVGGEVYSGFNFIDIIENIKTPLTIHIMPFACSMGLLIAMAGHNNPMVKTVCHKFSIGLLHSGSQYMEGTAHAVKDIFDFTQKYDDKIRDYILSHTNIDEELYEKIERKEYYMDSDEMLRLGIVDEII